MLSCPTVKERSPHLNARRIVARTTTRAMRMIAVFVAMLVTGGGTRTAARAMQPGQEVLDATNLALAESGVLLQVHMVEYITAADAPEFGRTILVSDRGNKQIRSDWVPNDPRRLWSGPGSSLSFVNDLREGGTRSGLQPQQTDLAILNAVATWDDLPCSTIPVVSFGSYNIDFGFVQWFWGFGGVPLIVADITYAGWLPEPFFDRLAPGGGLFILAATFSLVYLDNTGNTTDIDNNGRPDVGLKETYYNDHFAWAIGDDIDVETVALHETGHALSQAHFGDVFRNGAGKLHFAPRAVMNAGYSGVQQRLTGTDKAGHCANWAVWPNK